MIRDPDVKAEIQQDWAGVRKLCEFVHRCYMMPGMGVINETRPDDSYNIPLVLAYAVLDQVLNELIAQGDFKCKSFLLGEKMDASKGTLKWQDYQLVFNGKEARNDLAHKAMLVPKDNCLRFIDGIERELQAWGII
jgi:hypothetical protein